MAKRNIKEYAGLSRNIITNRLFTSLSAQGNQISYRHQFKSLLEESIFKWIFNTGSIPQAHTYAVDTSQSSIYDTGAQATIAIAADWASDTIQAEAIGSLMGAHEPDYTAHLGDTYYSGASDEINANFTNNRWPFGKKGTFALLGNHEMYHGAFPYFDALLPMLNQPNPFFCLRNDYWCILGLDTGYQSIQTGPSNTLLQFQPELMNWLENTVQLQNETRGIVVLSHHQYVSAFNDEVNYMSPAWQLQSFFLDTNREIIWIWGHEHRFSIYGKYKQPTNANDPHSPQYITAYGRCIGHGGMPDEHTSKRLVNQSLAAQYNLVLWDYRVADQMPGFLFQKIPIGANGYAILTLNNEQLTIDYYSSYTNDASVTPTEELIVTETWSADNQTGDITCINTIDHTIDANGQSQLTYVQGKTAQDMGR